MAEARPVDRWEDVGATDDFTHRKGKEVKIGARQIAVFRENDAFYAIKNICPHAAELLHFGSVQEIAPADGAPVETQVTWSLESGNVLVIREQGSVIRRMRVEEVEPDRLILRDLIGSY